MRFIMLACVLAVICAPLVRADDEEERHLPPAEALQRELRMRRARMEMENAERDMEFEQQMREIELEKHRLSLDRQRSGVKQHHRRGWCSGGRHGFFMAIWALVHILLAIWVFQDIRARGAGSGLWIVITLLAGFFGALIYAVVRIGDRPRET